MRLFSYLLCVTALGLAGVGCSRAPQEKAKVDETAKAQTNESANSNQPANGAPDANAGTQDAIPGITGPPRPDDANKTPQKSAGPNLAPAGAAIAAASRPAPDDSTFTSQLTDVGRETRTFRKHPQLLKVEKTIEPGKSTIKIFIRGGKVIDLPGDRINNLSTIPAADIMGLIGIASPETKGANPGDKEKKTQ